MDRTFVMGDIHGAYRALRQCLDRSGFDYNTDRLIFLGDVADGWPETRACVDELLKVRNLVYILGNHDWWTLEWMQTGYAEPIWLQQGGQATVDSYDAGIPETHVQLLNQAYFFFEDKHRMFVHAGFDPTIPIENQSMQELLWSRTLAHRALALHETVGSEKITLYDEVFLGHTPVSYPKPIQSREIWLMDTGAGWSGVLSMMDIDTKEVFTSDPVPSLYPGVAGRKRR